MSDYKTIKYVETFDGDYGSLINTPTIPSAVSDLSNDTGFITSSSVPTAVSELTNDSGYLTTAPAPTNAQILSGVASASYNGVGSYLLLKNSQGGYTLSSGNTFTGFGLTGTWRFMANFTVQGNNNNNTEREWVALRIS